MAVVWKKKWNIFENWFLASAPGNPILLRVMELVREKFLWKVQDVVELTGPGSLSDAVHEFLATTSKQGIPLEVFHKKGFSTKLSFPSESEHPGFGWSGVCFSCAFPQIVMFKFCLLYIYI